eukprot:TRINITY_DN782_c0_g1_i13.p3 TRINITY_DN782_c0_g1~~TRINITY_DN782_c0_g1_i13.p3  ORF type:complete len:327 (-),score=34.60 TRINITY_DN782_c0_g1_i13:250-1230(-)
MKHRSIWIIRSVKHVVDLMLRIFKIQNQLYKMVQRNLMVTSTLLHFSSNIPTTLQANPKSEKRKMMSYSIVLFGLCWLWAVNGQALPELPINPIECTINVLPDPVASLSNDTYNFVAGIVSNINAPDLSTFANMSAEVLDTVLPGASTLGDITMMIGGAVEGAAMNFQIYDPANLTVFLTESLGPVQYVCVEGLPMDPAVLIEQITETPTIQALMNPQDTLMATVQAVMTIYSDAQAATMESIENLLSVFNMTLETVGLSLPPEVPNPIDTITESLTILMGAIGGLLNQTGIDTEALMGGINEFVGGFVSGIQQLGLPLPPVPESP